MITVIIMLGKNFLKISRPRKWAGQSGSKILMCKWFPASRQHASLSARAASHVCKIGAQSAEDLVAFAPIDRNLRSIEARGGAAIGLISRRVLQVSQQTICGET
jgi:hypothetical protein